MLQDTQPKYGFFHNTNYDSYLALNKTVNQRSCPFLLAWICKQLAINKQGKLKLWSCFVSKNLDHFQNIIPLLGI